MDIKTQALLEVIKAYLNRGNKIQYDQRCMDRKLITTPRRDKYVSPETATGQKTVFLDCSSFVNVVFWETFGYEIPFELTWHMVDYFEPRVFLYERTYEETPEEIEEIKQKIKDTLKPGDVMTYDRFSGSGHTLIYLGDGGFAHCTPNGRPNSYDYQEKKSREYEDGGLFVIGIDDLINEKIFQSKTIKRIAIERPLDIVDEPTEKTMARLTTAKALICGVETSHPGGQHATKGENVTYSVKVKNNGEEDKEVLVTFTVPCGATLVGAGKAKETLSAGAEKTFGFEVLVENDEPLYLEGPEVTVNSLKVNAPKVLVGKKANAEEISKVCSLTIKEIESGKTAVEAASVAYEEIGILVDPHESQHIYNCFYIHDTLSGDVLSRRAQNPEKDMGVYSYFGGVTVITPEKVSSPHIRCNKTLRRDLSAGDIILVADDNYGLCTYSAFYNGEKLIGKFEKDGELKTLSGEEINAFIDSLLGQHLFIILRPSLAK
ncbi:MAG: C40 family peptidase [Clostridia bacterium]|nr:C40 family peptidase [Clostridia bacterium]